MGEIKTKFRMSKKNRSHNKKSDDPTVTAVTVVALDVLSTPSPDFKRRSNNKNDDGFANSLQTNNVQVDSKRSISRNDDEFANVPQTNTVPKRTLGSVCLGLLYGLLSGFLFSVCAAAVKYVDTLDPGQIAFYQYIAICLFSLPMVVRRGEKFFGPDNVCRRWIILCGVFDALTLYLAFLSFRYLPLSDASVITSSVPVFVTITARIFLKEPCGTAQLAAIAISVLGVVLVSKVPLLLAHRTDVYTRESVIGILACLGAVATESGVYILLRKLHEVDVFVILFNFGWVATVITGVLTLLFGTFTYSLCGSQQWLVIAVGVSSFLSQTTLTKALELEDAGPVSVLMSAGDVILAFAFHAIIFHDDTDIYTICGTFLVIFSVMILGFKKWFDEMPNGIISKKLCKIFG